MTLCVYAIAAPFRGRVAVKGVAGEPLRFVREGAVGAFVGALSRTPKPTEDNLREYDRVLRSLSTRATAILPARFGTFIRDADELRMILSSRQASLRRQLDRVRGRAQMTVRLRTHPRTLAPSHPRTGTEYLRARADAQRIPEFDALRSSVRRWVRDERMEKKGGVGSVYHLVPRGSAGAYKRALARGAAERGVRLVVSGPWPPYAFADPLG